jgi:hypothetical protein
MVKTVHWSSCTVPIIHCTLVFMYSTYYSLYTGLHVQYPLFTVHWSSCTVPIIHCTLVFMYSTHYSLYTGLHVQYPLFTVHWSSCTVPIIHCTLIFMYSTHYFCPILMKLLFSRQIFKKYSNIRFLWNLSSGSRVVACGRTDGRTNRRTEMTKLIIAVRNFSNAPKKKCRGGWLYIKLCNSVSG